MFKKKFGLRLVVTMAVVAVMASVATLPSRADNAGAVTAVAGTFTNNATWTIPTSTGAAKVDKSDDVGLQVKCSGSAAGTGNIIVTVARSGDGVSFETSPPLALKFTNALAGATTIVGYHQIPREVVGSAHSLRVVSVQNADATALGTNATVAFVIKKKF